MPAYGDVSPLTPRMARLLRPRADASPRSTRRSRRPLVSTIRPDRRASRAARDLLGWGASVARWLTGSLERGLARSLDDLNVRGLVNHVMSKPAVSVFVFGIYAACLACMLLIAPNVLLGLFRIPATTDVWIRIVGMLLLYLGGYYMLAARTEAVAFFRLSVWLRMSVIAFFGVFVLLGVAPPVLLLFGAVDFAMAAWTWGALRNAP